MNLLSSKYNIKNVGKAIYPVLILLLSIVAINCSNDIDENTEFITIGTFNIAWLGDGINDNNPRVDNDYKIIAEVISNSYADIIGLEEIENEAALGKLTKYLDNFSFFVGNESGEQNPAILFRNNIHLTQLRYVHELEVEPNKTKPGILFEVRKGNFDWLMMVVHFKSTSRYDSTDELQDLSRQLRRKQAAALSLWVDSVLNTSNEKDIIIVGDFNDYPGRKSEATLTNLVENKNIEFLTNDMKSCKYDYLYSIDHIIISQSVKERYLSNSVRMYNFFDALTEADAEKVSDHCPVFATFNISIKDND